jgi:hypothetical protein
MKLFDRILSRAQSRLCRVLGIFKKKPEPLPYGNGLGFVIWIGNGRVISGHITVYPGQPDDEKAQRLIESIVKICQENGVGADDAVLQIERNLRDNGLSR